MEGDNKKLCRICFLSGHFSFHGYEIDLQGNNVSIDTMIKRFSSTQFTEENVPEMICETCTHDLAQSYLFAEKILDADAKILSLIRTQEQEKLCIFEEELQIIKDSDEEFVGQSKGDDQIIEGRDYIEEQIDFIEESDDPNIIEHVYEDSEISQDEYQDTKETVCSTQLDSSENFGNKVDTYQSIQEEEEDDPTSDGEPKRKYQKRNKINKEVDKNGSFVITQFASSITAPRTHIKTEENDEVALNDVRIMNYQTVEVKAEDMNVVNQANHCELPIDDGRVYLCQYCPRAFSSSAFLIAHVRKTHGCKFCASVFEKAKELYDHIREAHSKFKCVVCDKEFVSNSNMRNHLKSIHKVKVPANVSLISYRRENDLEEES